MSETAVADMPETQQTEANPQLKRKPWHFTPEKARELQAKSIEARKAKRLAEQAELEQAHKQAEQAQAIILADALSKPKPIAIEPDEQYRLEQLRRVRDKIDSLWKELEQAEGGKEIQAITTAIEKLSNMEFNLAKRPKPAAYRTAPEKPKRSSGSTGPVDAD